MKKFFVMVGKLTIHICPRDTYLFPNCNYCNLTAYRRGDGFTVELDHAVKRDDEFEKIHYHNIGYVRTVADVFDIAKQYVRVTKVY